MRIWEIFLTGLSLSADACAVAMCKGVEMKKFVWKYALLIALCFGLFQALMPLIGWAVASQFAEYITAADHWIAFILLEKETDGALSAPHCAPAPRHPPPRPCGEARARRQDPSGDVRRDEHRRARRRRLICLPCGGHLACDRPHRRHHLRHFLPRCARWHKSGRQIPRQGGTRGRSAPLPHRLEDIARAPRRARPTFWRTHLVPAANSLAAFFLFRSGRINRTCKRGRGRV